MAAINGAVTGAGTQLALVCDVRLAATSARLIYREGRLGIIPSHGGVTRLVKLIGQARARDVILGGEGLTAEEAHRVGLVTEVVDDDALLERARERVALMLERSPQAYAAAKRLLWLAGNVDLESGMVAEGLAQIAADRHRRAQAGGQGAAPAMIIELDGKTPRIADDAFIAPTAVLIGDVTVRARAPRSGSAPCCAATTTRS